MPAPIRGPLIVDSSPLIFLARLDQLPLLRELASEVLVTPTVFHEVTVQGAGAPGAAVVQGTDWLRLQEPESMSPALSLLLDPGEAETLALAVEIDECVVVVDDGRGRRIAKRLGLRATGTLGILKRAVEMDLLPALKPVTDQLIDYGYRIKGELLETALRDVGELSDT